MKSCRYFSKINGFAVGIVTILLLIGNAAAVNTHIQTDGTLSGIAELNTNAPGSSQIYTLSEINGKLSGHNLFYSFSNFNIGTTDTAWFNLNTSDLANVISRVTGGTESIIDGQLRMTNVGNAPSFFFINPVGITFNSGASVDVPGSFYVSTASNLKLSDGGQYAASETSTSTLSSATPESFGFLGNEVGSLTLSGTETAKTNLYFKPGSDVALVANYININNAGITNTNNTQTGLDIQLIATGEESINIKPAILPDHPTGGDLNLRNFVLNDAGNGSSQLAIRSRSASVNDSMFWVINTGDPLTSGDQGIEIYARSLNSDQATFGTGAFANGDAGNITITVDFLKLSNKGMITSQNNPSFEGKSGSILINAGQIEIDNNSMISSGTLNTKDAGRIVLTAEILKLNNNSFIVSSALGATTGKGGDLIIHSKELQINENSKIGGDTSSVGKGGNVNVTADSLLLNSGLITSDSYGKGDGGSILINANNLEMHNSIISSSTFGIGNAGKITVVADDSIKLSNDTSLKRGIYTDSSLEAQGNSGNISITARNIEVSNAIISSNTFGEGNAGNIAVTANSIRLNRDINADVGIMATAYPGSKGNGGMITVDVKQLEINGAYISSGTFGNGNAGNVEVLNANSVKIHNSGGITTNAYPNSNGSGGAVTINVQQLEVYDDSIIVSGTGGKGNAGNVVVNANSVRLHNTGVISSSSTSDSEGNGGIILINAKQLEIDNAYIFSDTSSSGNAGQINVNVDKLQLHENGYISTNTFGSGHAGDITVTVDSLTARGTGNTTIDLSSNKLTGIFSGAGPESSGQTGNIDLRVGNSVELNNGALISIASFASAVDPNVKAGQIHVSSKDDSLYSLYLDSSVISTETAGGDGGTLTISNSDNIFLRNSQITTSVKGESGNGGDINIASNHLIMDIGFIQANTEAPAASGGLVNIDAPTVIPSGNLLLKGGNEPLEFQPFSGRNVIQAAAPTGISGVVSVATPQLNLNAMLTNLVIESFDSNALNRDMCAVSESSSLLQTGRGAQPLRARDLLLSPMF